jgi:hypothetical protein
VGLVVASVNTVAYTNTLTASRGIALAHWDTVHLIASSAQNMGWAATKDMNAPTVFMVNERPRLVELDGAAACRIDLITVENS